MTIPVHCTRGAQEREWRFSCFFRLFALLAAAVAIGLAALDSPAAAGSLTGERAVYQLRWSFIPAGEVVLEVLADDAIAGRPVSHFRLLARSLPHLDLFYRVRDRIESWFDGEKSLGYEKDQQEGRHRRQVRLAFDWRAAAVTYRNFGKAHGPVPLQPGTVDPLSAYYFLRSCELAPGVVIQRPVTDGKRVVVGRARVVRRESVATPAGRFDTVLVEPDIKDVRGVFEKTTGATMRLWLTDDDRRLLVRAASRVVVGSFVAELVSYRPPAGQAAAVDGS